MRGSRGEVADVTASRQGLRAAAMHLSALWGLALVQPTLELLSDGDNAAIFFVGRRVIGVPFLLVVAATAVLPLAALVGIEALAERFAGERWRERLHAFFIWGLSSLLVLYALERAWRAQAAKPNGAVLMILAAAGLGLVLTMVYRRWLPLRSVLSFLSPVPLLSLALFAFASPASGLVFAGGGTKPIKAPASATPVVMVVFDELPVSTLMDDRERIDARRFPNFGALAHGATWYREYVTAGDDTVQAVPSILTAHRPKRGVQPVYSAQPNNIFKLLGTSHRVVAREHATWLCSPGVCPSTGSTVGRMGGVASALGLAYFDTIVPPGLFSKLHVGMPEIGRTFAEALRPERPERSVDELIRQTREQPRELERYPDAQFTEFLRAIRPYRPRERPAPLYMMHSNLPHVPWVFLPNGRTYAPIREGLPGLNQANEQWSRLPLAIWLGWQRHILQTRYADRALGALLATLRRRGLYDRALIVVTADHGASFIPGDNRRFVTKANAADVSTPPLFIKAPGQRRPEVVDRALQSVDLLPTIADLLNVRIPWHVDGRSALGAGAGRRSVTISSFKNPALTTSPATIVGRRSATVRRQTTLFGTGLDGGGGFGIGPVRGLVGRRVSTLRLTRSRGGRASITRTRDFAGLDPTSRFVPAARVAGRAQGAKVTAVAVAVNGWVAAVGPAFAGRKGSGFSLLLSPDHMRRGRNSVRVYALRGNARRPLLEPLQPLRRG